MAIDRVANTLLTPLNPEQRHHVNDDPARSPGASGLDVAREGCATIDRADPRGYSGQRYGLTPPVRNRPASEYGDEIYNDILLY